MTISSQPALDFVSACSFDEGRLSLVCTEGMVRFNASTIFYHFQTPTPTEDCPPLPPTSGRLGGAIQDCPYSQRQSTSRRISTIRDTSYPHICRGCQRFIYRLAFSQDTHNAITDDAPLVDMLVHLPPLPLVIDYGV